MTQYKPLLDLLGKAEAGRLGYNATWSGIKSYDRPERPITEMTIKEILDWQDRIDPKYRSEAAGRYQIMEDTLRGLWRETPGITLQSKFNEKNQDKLAIQLARRRGLHEYMLGKLSLENFGNNLAKEWAGLPCLTGRKKGRSYYGGDGLNSATVSVEDVYAALTALKAEKKPPWYAAILAFFRSIASRSSG